jgi:hypothetical protein
VDADKKLGQNGKFSPGRRRGHETRAAIYERFVPSRAKDARVRMRHIMTAGGGGEAVSPEEIELKSQKLKGKLLYPKDVDGILS